MERSRRRAWLVVGVICALAATSVVCVGLGEWTAAGGAATLMGVVGLGGGAVVGGAE